MKSQILYNDSKITLNKSFENICGTHKLTAILNKGVSCPSPKEIERMPLNTFVPYQKNHFVFKNNHSLYIFNHEGFNQVLNQRQGLGNTGEIYLVGNDYHIKSASRFFKNWQNIEVINNSIINGLQKKTGTEIVFDYRNVKVVSSYSHFLFDQLEFVVLSEIDWKEITIPLNKVLYDLIKIGTFLFFLSMGVAYFLSKSTIQIFKKMTEEIENLNRISAKNVIKIQEEEREKIAYNLHDSVGQYMTALKWGLSQLKLNISNSTIVSKADELSKLCEEVIKELRTISQDIMPTLIRDFGCFLAIQDYLDQQKKLYSIEVEYHFPEEASEIKFKRLFQLNLYRMVQEFFQNAIKHSQASIIKINFSIRNGQLLMLYEDNGIGINEQELLPRSLNYRAQLFNGKLIRISENSSLRMEVSFKIKEVIDEKN